MIDKTALRFINSPVYIIIIMIMNYFHHSEFWITGTKMERSAICGIILFSSEIEVDAKLNHSNEINHQVDLAFFVTGFTFNQVSKKNSNSRICNIELPDTKMSTSSKTF